MFLALECSYLYNYYVPDRYDDCRLMVLTVSFHPRKSAWVVVALVEFFQFLRLIWVVVCYVFSLEVFYYDFPV